jgi:hypothetical protein
MSEKRLELLKKILEIVDDAKETITDQEYIEISNYLMELHKSEKRIDEIIRQQSQINLGAMLWYITNFEPHQM